MRKILATSALPYANGPIHIGHLVEYIQTDIWVRYWKLRGRDALYICADDTHGTPIMMRAREEGLLPEELIESVWHEHRRDFAGFQIEFDTYSSTNSTENHQLCIEIYQALRRNGHIVERVIEQAYCDTCQIFLPDRYIRGRCPNCNSEDQYGDSCEVCSATYDARQLVDPYCVQCGGQPAWRESNHIFFRLSDFTTELKAWLNAGHVQTEIVSKLQEWFDVGLHDWDISRDAPYFGFEIPDKPGKFFYVWLDAPIGYIAATLEWCQQNNGDFAGFWRRDDADLYHFIGKDIIYFHALFWPAMLMGSGFRTPTGIFVHGFLTVNGEKMSKSRGTFIKAETYLRHLDPQYLRYYYASKLGPGVDDLDFSSDDFVNRVNADLINKIANIPSRTLAIIHKYCGGRLASVDNEGRELIAGLLLRRDAVARHYEDRELARVALVLAQMAGQINDYLQAQSPWKVARRDSARAMVICTSALNAFKVLATLMKPILPQFSDRFAEFLEIPPLCWSGLDQLVEQKTVRPYQHLVQRVDRDKVDAMLADSRESLGEEFQTVEAPAMTLDPLVDCDFRTMRVVAAFPVAGSDQLVALSLKANGQSREVLAGVGPTTDNLLNRVLLALPNLEPRKLMGRESHGMIVGGKTDQTTTPLFLPDGQENGILD